MSFVEINQSRRLPIDHFMTLEPSLGVRREFVILIVVF